MPHIHTNNGEHDLTSSAFIVYSVKGHEPQVWLHRHRKLNQWLQFGGHVETTEHVWSAVCHEIEEESGYEIEQLCVLQPPLRLKTITKEVTLHPQPVFLFTHQFPGLDHSHTDITYAFVTEELPAHNPQAGESSALKRFSVEDLEALPSSDIPENVREIALFVLETIIDEWESVGAGSFDRGPA